MKPLPCISDHTPRRGEHLILSQKARLPATFQKQRFVEGFSLAFSDGDYRAIFIALVAMGMAVGIIIPYITLWATQTFNVSPLQASLFFVPMGLVGLCIGLVTAAYSDYFARRKPVIILALAVGAICRCLLAVVHSYDAAIILFAATGFSPFPFMFALLNDVTRKNMKGEMGARVGVITGTQRMGFSLGWLAGPVFGAKLFTLGGYSSLFFVSGCLFATILVWVMLYIKEQTMDAPSRPVSIHASIMVPKGVLLISIAGALIFAGDYARSMFLPLYINGPLKEPVSLVGAAFSVTVISELLFMPFSGYLADRFGTRRLFIFGLGSQVFFFLLLGLSSSYWQVILLQILYAFVISISMNIGIVYAQSLHPTGAGMATTAYLGTMQVAPIISSLVLGALAGHIGLPFPFFAASGLTLIAILLVTMTRPPEGIKEANR